jgi:predicted Zn-dependent protease
MLRRVLPIGLLAAVGCFPDPSATQLVPANPFQSNSVVQPPKHVSYSPAAEETAKRVGLVGQKVLMANPQLGMRPLFRTIGAPHAEVFHIGQGQICVTEGLVKQCASDGHLAAVLCVELSKMIAEREALAGPQAQSPDRQPPIEMRVGNDSGGPYGAPDLTHLAELGKYEKERRQSAGATLDPQALARTCLMKAGYTAADLEAVAPLLRTSATNGQLEKQLTAPGPARSWTQ